MKKTLLTAVLALTLAATSAFAAPNTVQVSASDGEGLGYTQLYTESSWMSLVVPMSALEYIVPGDLSLSVTGLPEGTTITLDGVTQRGNTPAVERECEPRRHQRGGQRHCLYRSDVGRSGADHAEHSGDGGGFRRLTHSLPPKGTATSSEVAV